MADSKITTTIAGTTYTVNTPTTTSSNSTIVIDGKTYNIIEKQDTLVSGTNIKTINGDTILGEGDAAISDYNFTKTYKDYLDAQLWNTNKPVTYLTSPSSTSKEIGTTYTLSSITHYETHTDFIDSLKFYIDDVETMDVEPSSTSATVDVSDTQALTKAGSVTYKLIVTNAEHSYSYPASKTISWYVPSYIIGASSTPTSLDTYYTKGSSIKGTQTVTFESITNMYLIVPTSTSISKITASGFDVPFSTVSSSTAFTINDISVNMKIYMVENVLSDTFIIS